MFRKDVLLGSLAFIVLFIWSGFAVAGERNNLTLTTGEGAVKIAITYLKPIEKIENGQLAFEVRMDTHSVNLDQYRMEDLTFLKDDQGNEYKALGWFSPRGEGHHRSGIVKFPNKKASGRPIIGPKTKYIEVIIKGVDSTPRRVYRWKFPL
jgi:hypothetical protein